MNDNKILNVLQGPMTEDKKWYHCPHCDASFNFMDVMNQEAAKRVDDNYRLFKCNNCDCLFLMPE